MCVLGAMQGHLGPLQPQHQRAQPFPSSSGSSYSSSLPSPAALALDCPFPARPQPHPGPDPGQRPGPGPTTIQSYTRYAHAQRAAAPPHLVGCEEVEHQVCVEEEVDQALEPEPEARGGLVKALFGGPRWRMETGV